MCNSGALIIIYTKQRIKQVMYLTKILQDKLGCTGIQTRDLPTHCVLRRSLLHYRVRPPPGTRTVGPFQVASTLGGGLVASNPDQDPDTPRACTSRKSRRARLRLQSYATGAAHCCKNHVHS